MNEEELVCPECGWDKCFDVYSAKSCDDPHAWIHCPNCTHKWQPNPPTSTYGELE